MVKPKTVLILIICLFFVLKPSYISNAMAQRKMVVVTINTLTLKDILLSSDLTDMTKSGALGLISTRSNGTSNIYKPYMTLGSGQRGEAYFNCINCVKIDDNTEQIYRELTLNKCDNGNIVNLSINKLIDINSKTLYKAVPGKLGSSLRANDYKTGFIGGFWYENSIKSPAFFICMDNCGICDYGEIEGVFHDGRIDSAKLVDRFNKYYPSCDFMVIELGDLESLYSYRRLYSSESYNASRKRIIMEYSRIIKSIKNSIDFSNTVLCVLSAYCVDTDKHCEMLNPFIIYDGGKSTGIITSRTTRRDGIVSAVDFSPYVLKYFGIEDKGFLGYPIEIKSMDNNIEYVMELNQNIYNTSISRVPILKNFAILVIIVLLLYIFRILKGYLLNFIIKFVLFVPLGFLIEGYVKAGGIIEKTLFIIFLSITSAFIIGKIFKKNLDFILVISMLSILALAFDMLLGLDMLKNSVFSYDPIIGARFYGMGNEFLGVMIGCSIILSGALMEKDRKLKYIAFILLTLSSLITGLPQIGSNTGGFITAVACFMFFAFLEHGWTFKKSVALSIAASACGLLLMIIVNILFKNAESHLGKMVSLICVDGFSYFFNLIYRKLSTAVRLIKSTIWSKVLITLMATGIWFVLKPVEYVKKFFANYPHMKNSWIAVVYGAIIALATNDSGIVTAAVMMLYAIFSVILLLSEES